MSQDKIDTISINNVEYVRKDQLSNQKAESLDGMKYVIVRAQSAGVFAGFLKEKNGQEVKLVNARRLWYWSGAASLSQLAVDGTSKPKDCKFPTEVASIEINQVIEVIDCSKKAQDSIKGVAVWAM